MKENGKQKTAGLFLVLHVSLLMSSLSGVCSKMAANQKSLIGFALWYGGVLLIMALHLPLTVAYANKPVSLIWGMIWGTFIFGEKITWNMILGALIIFGGIYLVVTADE